MLRQRVITAIILLAILIPSMFYGKPWFFVAIMTLLIAGAYWEWSRLNSWTGVPAVLAAIIGALACLSSWHFGWPQNEFILIAWLFGLAWLIASLMVLAKGVAGWREQSLLVRNFSGYFTLWVTYIAMIHAWSQGVNFFLSILALVWLSDCGAYFAGRAFGGKFFSKKLAPSLSPSKTWEGLFGALVAALITAYVWLAVDQHFALTSLSLYSQLYAHSAWALPAAVIFLSLIAILGDLLESLCKRAAGIKDSSQLFPGHGGVLDRIDSIIPVIPLAILLCVVL